MRNGRTWQKWAEASKLQYQIQFIWRGAHGVSANKETKLGWQEFEQKWYGEKN